MQIIKRAIQMFITLTLRIYGLNKTLTKQMLKEQLEEAGFGISNIGYTSPGSIECVAIRGGG